MKALKVLVIILLATFSYQAVNAQTMHHKKQFKSHHRILHRHVARR